MPDSIAMGDFRGGLLIVLEGLRQEWDHEDG